MALRVRVAEPTELAAVLALRHTGVDPGLESDAVDADAVHAVACDDDRMVGAGRLVSSSAEQGHVSRIAVSEAARGQGVDAAVLRFLERAAIHRGHAEVTVYAQVEDAGLYQRAGYVPVGDQDIEAGVDRQELRKSLPVLRAGTDADSAALITLIGDTWSEYPGCVLDIDGEEPWLRAPASAFAALDGRLWIATVDGSVVACAAMKPGGDGVVELKSLYVSAKARRQGLGELLTDLVEQEAAERGAHRIELWSDSRFADAHRLYTRLGYQRLPHTRELHDLSNTTEYAFAKDLEV